MAARENLYLGERAFEALKDTRVVNIAIANPERAIDGRAPVAALQTGMYEQVKAKLVCRENILQAAQFAQSGSAQAGIIARSRRFAESMQGRERWEIPVEFYPPLEQAAVIIKASKSRDTAKEFLEFVESEEGRKILLEYGLIPPGEVTAP